MVNIFLRASPYGPVPTKKSTNHHEINVLGVLLFGAANALEKTNPANQEKSYQGNLGISEFGAYFQVTLPGMVLNLDFLL